MAELKEKTESLLHTFEERRTYYGIGKSADKREEQVETVIRRAVRFTPTAFNSQSGRVVLLLNAQHDRLWKETEEILRGVVPAGQFEKTRQKVESFRAGDGTILFFEDQSVVQGLQQKFPLYKDNFPIWSQQATGMLQLAVWTALETEGFGVNLQHYNPLIDGMVRKNWHIPENWLLLGQMPFGSRVRPADPKDYLPVEGRFVIYR